MQGDDKSNFDWDDTQRHAFVSQLDGTRPAPRRPRKRRIAKSALWDTAAGWRLRFASHKSEGKWVRPTVLLGYFPDRAAAEAEARRFLEARRREAPAPGTSPPWPEFSARYVAECVPRMRPESQATTRSVIACHIDPRFADCRLHEVGARVQRWLDDMHDADPPVPLSSMQHRWRVLRSMLVNAESRELAVFIPVKLKWPKPSRVRRAATVLTFSAEEQRTVFGAARWPLKAALAIGFYAGLRPGETVGLEWRLLDLGRGQLIVSQQRARGGSVALPKTAASEGVIAIVPELAAILERYYQHQRKRHFQRPTGFVFPGRDGGAMSHATLRVRQLYPLLEGLDLPRRGLHACRRAFADRMLESNATIREIQAALRHSSLRTTERYLAKAQPAAVVAAIRRAAELGCGVAEIAEEAI